MTVNRYGVIAIMCAILLGGSIGNESTVCHASADQPTADAAVPDPAAMEESVVEESVDVRQQQMPEQTVRQHTVRQHTVPMPPSTADAPPQQRAILPTVPIPLAAAGPPTDLVADQVVLASTRQYSSQVGRVLEFSRFQGRELSSRGQMLPYSVRLDSSDRFVETWIFVHGNQIPPNDAVRRGMMVYRRLRGHSRLDLPIRFVIWSWPSERDTGYVRDAHIKRERTDAEAFYLGSYIASIAGEGNVSLIAYSFGTRIVTGALHLASGGSLRGFRLPQVPDNYAPFRVAFMAAAVEADGVLPGGRYCQALQRVDAMMLMNNSKDLALNLYWATNLKDKPKALGSVGLLCRPPQTQVEQYDWAKQLGREHSLFEYVNRSSIASMVARHLER